MSRIESGKIDLVLSQIHLPGLIERLTDMCRPLIIQKSQHFQVSISRIDHENIVADGERLLQILMNLLSNAVKYTPEGELDKAYDNILDTLRIEIGEELSRKEDF